MKKNISKVLSIMCSLGALSGAFGINSASAMDGKESDPSSRRSTKSSLTSKECRRDRTDKSTSDESDDEEETLVERPAARPCCDSAAVPNRRVAWLEERAAKEEELRQKVGNVQSVLNSISGNIGEVTPDTSIVDSYGAINIDKFILVCMFKLESLYQNSFGESLFDFENGFVEEISEHMLERKNMNHEGLCMLVSFVNSLLKRVEIKASVSKDPEIELYLQNACREVKEFGKAIKNMSEILDILSVGNVDAVRELKCTSKIVSIIEKMRPETNFSISIYDLMSLDNMIAELS